MTFRTVFTRLLAGAAVFAMLAVPAAAEDAPQLFTTADGVLSIEAPSTGWNEVENSSYWFEMTDGDCILTISHLSNGETLPPQAVANDKNHAVVQTLISTRNEVFAVNAVSGKQEHLQELLKAVGSINVLSYDTKKAVAGSQTASTAAEPAAAKKNTADEAGKQIEVYTRDGSAATLTLGADGVWKDSNGVIFHNTIDDMYYDELNGLFWSSDKGYWKKHEEEGITTWVSVYAEDGSVDSVGLGTDNVWRNASGTVFTFATADTYTDEDGTVWAIAPDYWGHADGEFQYMFTVYSEDGTSQSIGLGYDNVYKNAQGISFEMDSTETYVDEHGTIWATYPEYWGDDAGSYADSDEYDESYDEYYDYDEDYSYDDYSEDDYDYYEEDYE